VGPALPDEGCAAIAGQERLATAKAQLNANPNFKDA
jgi:hypothetical protein